eukprot:CCRYP_019189-RA/>CCRYP_019189-RA protein AED:0.41 eAED:0.41 QI:0/-1/0/1/-1/1/1/0/98
MESMDSRIPKPKKVGWTEKHCVLCKNMGPHKSLSGVTAVAITRAVLYQRMGAQVSRFKRKKPRCARIVGGVEALHKKSSKRKESSLMTESDSDSGDSS